MKLVIISIFLLSISLHIAAAIICYQCHERNSDTCAHEKKEYPDGYKCVTVNEEFKFFDTYHSILKGWSDNAACNENPYAYVNNDLYMKTEIKCCDEDYCNDGFFESPKEEAPKGYKCPSCLKMDTLEECEPDNEITCRDKEDKCLKFAGPVKKPDDVIVTYSAKGCMSPSLCESDLSDLTGVTSDNETLFVCTDPPKPKSEEIENEETSN